MRVVDGSDPECSWLRNFQINIKRNRYASDKVVLQCPVFIIVLLSFERAKPSRCIRGGGQMVFHVSVFRV